LAHFFPLGLVYTPLPFLVFASPPPLDSVVVTPEEFFSELHDWPVLGLDPDAWFAPLHTVSPRALVEHCAKAFDDIATHAMMMKNFFMIVSS